VANAALPHHSAAFQIITLTAIASFIPSFLLLRRRPHRPDHALQTPHPHHLLRLPKPYAQITQHGRVSNVRSVAVAVNVGRPLELCGVGVSGADVARLEGFELLLGAEFVGLEGEGTSVGEWGG